MAWSEWKKMGDITGLTEIYNNVASQSNVDVAYSYVATKDMYVLIASFHNGKVTSTTGKLIAEFRKGNFGAGAIVYLKQNDTVDGTYVNEVTLYEINM